MRVELQRTHAATAPKVATGIVGFDQISGGGLPRGRTTLLVGEPGSGKTILGLQFLALGAQHRHEAGIFVAFEETAARLMANAESFGWNLVGLARKRLSFIDAQPDINTMQSGDFDLGGLLATLQAKVAATRARRIVFDALDVFLSLLPTWAARRREVYRLHAWLQQRDLTGVLTLNAGANAIDQGHQQSYEFMQYMADCVVILNHNMVRGVSQRMIRVLKYRGSGFDENEAPFLIGSQGLEVVGTHAPHQERSRASNERISSGVARLDTMLGGGFHRGACVLITGFPGTAKTTLSGAFAEAACRRGERTLFISFDSRCAEVVRNLGSVGIRLDRYLRNGRLRMVSARTITGSAETYLARIKAMAIEHRARCVVIDPVCTWSTSIADLTSSGVISRLIEWSKSSHTTLLCTGLYDETANRFEGGSPLQISTLADTWIHLSYVVQAGERNRGLSIIKSRGSAHSNQVRELVLSDRGITLADAYTADGAVLMGTMRWEKERAEGIASATAAAEAKIRRTRLDAELAQLEEWAKQLQTGLLAKQREQALLERATLSGAAEQVHNRTRLRALRGADAALTRR